MKRISEAHLTAFGGLIALAAAIGIGRFVYTPILPTMMSALGLSKSAAGLIASANFLGYLLGALLAAWPNLPGSRRAWLLSALAVSAITTAGMGLASTMPRSWSPLHRRRRERHRTGVRLRDGAGASGAVPRCISPALAAASRCPLS